MRDIAAIYNTGSKELRENFHKSFNRRHFGGPFKSKPSTPNHWLLSPFSVLSRHRSHNVSQASSHSSNWKPYTTQKKHNDFLSAPRPKWGVKSVISERSEEDMPWSLNYNLPKRRPMSASRPIHKKKPKHRASALDGKSPYAEYLPRRFR